MKTMCPPGYHHNGFMATHALGHMMYGYIHITYIYVFVCVCVCVTLSFKIFLHGTKVQRLCLNADTDAVSKFPNDLLNVNGMESKEYPYITSYNIFK